MEQFGLSIRTLRRQHGWTLYVFAEKLGMSSPALSKIETGVTDINYSRLEQIAALFGISVAELLATGKPERDLSQLDQAIKDAKAALHQREQMIIALQIKLIELHEAARMGYHIAEE